MASSGLAQRCWEDADAQPQNTRLPHRLLPPQQPQHRRLLGTPVLPAVLLLNYLRVATAIAACLLLLPSPPATASVAQKKHLALDQYHKALQLREALNGAPENERSADDYETVIEAFRKVYHVAPTSTRADSSVLAVAELLTEKARLEDDDKGFEAAIGQYEFLCREYPGSRYRFDALLSIAQIYRDDLGDDDAARASFDDFLKRYPNHPLAENAKAALKEMDQEKKEQVTATREQERGNKPQVSQNKSPNDSSSRSGTPVAVKTAEKHQGVSLVTSIRFWSTPDYTRIAIDLGDEIKYEAGRVPSPDRIFFDLQDSRLASELIGKSYDIDDGLLKKIRVAQYKANVARVVLEVDTLAEYSAFLLPNPYRLIIDVHGRKPAARVETAKVQPSLEDKLPGTAAKITQVSATNEDEPNPPKAPTKASTASGRRTERGTITPAKTAALPPRTEVPLESRDLDLTEIATLSEDPQQIKATSRPTSGPVVENVAKRESKKISDRSDSAPSSDQIVTKNTRKKGNTKSAAVVPAGHEAAPTADGDFSLVRALGLKIGKIVVDAGHGGHDTGTIGPNGLLEKDLVLDVALRLGKLLEQKLGADVVYTRDDDTFIPLETRTAIANQNQADLFISIHANSSPDPSARGVETYYLNFTRNADALEVAARENAVSETSVHDLQDLVKKIALKDKIDESREFAADVQRSLYAGESSKSPGVKNRGVKKAPFIVLIGANMPSILAEISFVSNPTDARKLRTPEYRQKIAESLYRGVTRYAQGLSGIKVASAKTAVATGQ